MIATKLYIGLNDKKTKKQEHSNLILRDIIYECLFDYGYKAFTCVLAEGVYKHYDGHTVSENTYIITLINCDTRNLHELVTTLKKELNQECIMIEQYNSNAKFI